MEGNGRVEYTVWAGSPALPQGHLPPPSSDSSLGWVLRLVQARMGEEGELFILIPLGHFPHWQLLFWDAQRTGVWLN